MIELDADSPDYSTSPHERLLERYRRLREVLRFGREAVETATPDSVPDQILVALEVPGLEDDRICHACGCSELDPCPEGCWWHDDDLCSRCGEFSAELLDLIIGRGEATRAAHSRPTPALDRGDIAELDALLLENHDKERAR